MLVPKGLWDLRRLRNVSQTPLYCKLLTGHVAEGLPKTGNIQADSQQRLWTRNRRCVRVFSLFLKLGSQAPPATQQTQGKRGG